MPCTDTQEFQWGFDSISWCPIYTTQPNLILECSPRHSQGELIAQLSKRRIRSA